MKNTITEMKNTLEGINSRLNDIKAQISNLEDKVVEITAIEQKKRIKNENKQGQFKRPLGQHQAHLYSHYRGLRGRREKGY